MAVDTGWLNLPTLEEVSRTRRAVPKGAIPTRLQVKEAARKDDERKLKAFTRAVWIRDGGKDRYSGKRVAKTLSLDPKRGEVHHHEPRENQDTRYDVRNGILLSLETHGKVTRCELRVVGRKYFTVNGKKYLDMTTARVVKP